MANKEAREKWTIESVTPVITETILATEGVASLQPVPPISQGVLITNIFGNVDVDIFVNRIKEILEDPDLYGKMCQKSLDIFNEKLTIKTMVDKYFAIYKRIYSSQLK